MRRLLLLTSLTPALAQLPRTPDGYVVYRCGIVLPGLTRAEVLARAVRYARAHLLAQDSPDAAAWLVDTARAVVSGTGRQPGFYPLRYKLLLYAEVGHYRYELSKLATQAHQTSSPVVPGASLRPATRYEPVEAMLARASSYDKQHQPTARLGIYCSFVEEEVAAAVRQLLTEMEQL